MIVTCATVFLGTVYPLIIDAFTKEKISVVEPYFNSKTIHIMIQAILVMVVEQGLLYAKNGNLIQRKIRIDKKKKRSKIPMEYLSAKKVLD